MLINEYLRYPLRSLPASLRIRFLCTASFDEIASNGVDQQAFQGETMSMIIGLSDWIF